MAGLLFCEREESTLSGSWQLGKADIQRESSADDKKRSFLTVGWSAMLGLCSRHRF